MSHLSYLFRGPLLAVLSAVLLLLNGCQKEPKPQLTTIDGLVIDADTSLPIIGYAIGIGGSTGNTFSGTSKSEVYARLLTDSSGRFSFSKEILPAYTVVVYSLGSYYVTDCLNQCIVFSGEKVSLTLRMKKP